MYQYQQPESGESLQSKLIRDNYELLRRDNLQKRRRVKLLEMQLNSNEPSKPPSIDQEADDEIRKNISDSEEKKYPIFPSTAELNAKIEELRIGNTNLNMTIADLESQIQHIHRTDQRVSLFNSNSAFYSTFYYDWEKPYEPSTDLHQTLEEQSPQIPSSQYISNSCECSSCLSQKSGNQSVASYFPNLSEPTISIATEQKTTTYSAQEPVFKKPYPPQRSGFPSTSPTQLGSNSSGIFYPKPAPSSSMQNSTSRANRGYRPRAPKTPIVSHTNNYPGYPKRAPSHGSQTPTVSTNNNYLGYFSLNSAPGTIFPNSIGLPPQQSFSPGQTGPAQGSTMGFYK